MTERTRVIRSPGRVNLIGEHTDYHDGFVLPVAIDLEIRLAIEPTDDDRVEITLDETGERDGFSLDALPDREGRWIDYVAGVAWALAEAGLARNGFRGHLTSTLPVAAGLSSSAALELAAMWALSGGAAPPIDPMAAAKIAQRAENEFVGVRCGLMDQFAVACGRAGHALLLDCRSEAWEPVPLPDDLALVVIHTGSERSLATSAYNDRRADGERAVEALGVRSLRDVDAAMLAERQAAMDPVAARRARHVVDENARVLATVDALRTGDHDALGDLFAESHASLRDLYEVSSPELDRLVVLATAVPGVIAARMTGAGFGGCTINLVQPDGVDRLRAAIADGYRSDDDGERAWLRVVRAVDGVGLLD